MSQCEKDQVKWYGSTKMHSDMIMPRCKLVPLRSITNEMVMPQYRATSEMTKLHWKLSQVSMSWSNHLKKSVNTNEMAMLLYKHIYSNHPTISYTPMWNKNLITFEEWLRPKIHHRLRRVCPCVRYTRWNIPIMFHAPMWKWTSNLLRGMAMTQKSIIDRDEYASA